MQDQRGTGSGLALCPLGLEVVFGWREKDGLEGKFLLHRADNKRTHDMKMQSEIVILLAEDNPREAELGPQELNPNSEVRESACLGRGWTRPRGQIFGPTPGFRSREHFHASEVFREGAESSARGGRALHSISEFGSV